VFQYVQSANLPIEDPTAKVTLPPQTATGSSFDIQPIQNQSGDGKAKDPAVITSTQSNVEDQVIPMQNRQNYPAMGDQDGRLTGWSLHRDHFENDIPNFLGPQPEEVPELKYPQSYQATFGGTPRTAHMNGEGVVFVYFNHGKAFERVKINPAHAHMVIPTEKIPPIPSWRSNLAPPQRSAQPPVLGMPVPTASL
jgi:hypothetical protein